MSTAPDAESVWRLLREAGELRRQLERRMTPRFDRTLSLDIDACVVAEETAVDVLLADLEEAA